MFNVNNGTMLIHINLVIMMLFAKEMRAHIAGDKVQAQIADNAIETVIHTANCLYITPVIPPINIIGTNTAIKTIAIATSDEPTSSIVN